MDKSPGKSDQDLLTLLEQQPDGLSWVSNLGMMNVFASTSGKEAAAKHIIQHFGTTPEMSFLLCDDENDLGAWCAGANGACQTLSLSGYHMVPCAAGYDRMVQLSGQSHHAPTCGLPHTDITGLSADACAAGSHPDRQWYCALAQ